MEIVPGHSPGQTSWPLLFTLTIVLSHWTLYLWKYYHSSSGHFARHYLWKCSLAIVTTNCLQSRSLDIAPDPGHWSLPYFLASFPGHYLSNYCHSIWPFCWSLFLVKLLGHSSWSWSLSPTIRFTYLLLNPGLFLSKSLEWLPSPSSWQLSLDIVPAKLLRFG